MHVLAVVSLVSELAPKMESVRCCLVECESERVMFLQLVKGDAGVFRSCAQINWE